MLIGHHEEPVKVLLRVWPSTDTQEVDKLNQQAGMASARLANRVNKTLQTWHITVVGDTQQRATRYISNTSRLDDDRAGPTLSKTAIPIDDILCHLTLFIGAPWDHRGDPSPLLKGHAADTDRRKKTT